MDNLPLGAANNPNAPFNEPLNVSRTRFVSVTISYYDTLELPPDATGRQIEEAFIDKANSGKFPKEFNVDEIVILDE